MRLGEYSFNKKIAELPIGNDSKDINALNHYIQEMIEIYSCVLKNEIELLTDIIEIIYRDKKYNKECTTKAENIALQYIIKNNIPYYQSRIITKQELADQNLINSIKSKSKNSYNLIRLGLVNIIESVIVCAYVLKNCNKEYHDKIRSTLLGNF